MNTPNMDQNVFLEFITERWREGFLRTVYYVTAVLGFFAVLIYISTSGFSTFSFLAMGFYALFLAFTFLPLHFNLRAGFLLLVLNVMSLLTLLDSGVMGGALVFYLGTTALSTLIFSPRTATINTVVNIILIAVIGYFTLEGGITLFAGDVYKGTASIWIQNTAYYGLLATVTLSGIRLLKQDFFKARTQANELFTALSSEKANLSEHVQERTSDLEKANLLIAHRASQYEAISVITGAISVIRSSSELLDRVTHLIARQFNFYHIGIFTNDPSDQYAVLSTSSSEGGQKLINRDYRLKIDEEGLVGIVAGTEAARIAQENIDPNLLIKLPELPESRSEIALPLKSAGKTIGVLNIHSTQDAFFTSEDIRIFSLLADQVSLAIENVRLFEQTTRSLAETESLYRQYIHQEWEKLPGEMDLAGYRYSGQAVVPIPESERSDDTSQKENIPLLLRGETIGYISIKMPDSANLAPDQKNLIESVADRVSLALENARLFEDSTRRAVRERTVSEITTRIRGTTDPQLMLQTALEELRRTLGTDEISIHPYAAKPDAGFDEPAGSMQNQEK